jgi:hypothetical protein
MVKILFGIEVEAEINTNKMRVVNASYHSREVGFPYTLGQYFKTEGDGSLRLKKFHKSGMTTEIITQKPQDVANYKEVIQDFKNAIIEKSKTPNLSDVLNFNDTTGCHIHLSLMSDKGLLLPFKMASPKEFVKFNKRLLKEVKTQMPHIYGKFSRSFYRSYALKRITEENRYCCWNYSLNEINRLEFRSFNLRGVDNWEDFEKMFDIVFGLINEFCADLIKVGFNHEIKVSPMSLKAITNKIKDNYPGEIKRKILVMEEF